MSSAPSGQAWSTVDAALRAARALHQMETACFVVVSTSTASYLRVTGSLAGLDEGTHYPRADSLIARMLDGAAATAAGLDGTPGGSDTAEYRQLDVRSYVAMPVVRTDGELLGLLVGLDRGEVSVPPGTVAMLRGVADALAASGGLPAVRPPDAAGATPAAGPGPAATPAVGAEGVGGGAETTGPAGAAAESTGAAAETSGAGTGTGPEGNAEGEPHPGSEAGPGPGHAQDERPGPGQTPGPAAAAAAAQVPSAPPRAPSPSSNAPGPAAPVTPRPPGRMPTPQTVARAVRPGPPGRAGPLRPAPNAVLPGGGGPGDGAAVGGGTGPASAAGSARLPAGPPRGHVDLRLRRTSAGWIVEGPGPELRPVGDLISAMVLADLLAEDLAPPGRPRRADRDLGEIEQLRLSVVQLEHALASRVIVEQAIGVLAERHRIRPREAFERLRRTARGMGRRVHDLARQVVDSVGDPRAPLPGELGGRGGPGSAAPPGGGPTGSGPGGGGAPRPAPPRPTSSRR